MRVISIVPTNVHLFIDDSEIYGTIIVMMHFLTRTNGGKERVGGYFYVTTLQERHVGANATFSIILFITLGLTVDERPSE